MYVAIPQDCRERSLVTGAGNAALERKDPCSGETPLVSQVQLDEYENAKRLLQAGADANAATAGGEWAMMILLSDCGQGGARGPGGAACGFSGRG